MSTRVEQQQQQQQQQGSNKVSSLLREWDRGNRAARIRMLNTFIAQNQGGKTYVDLETDFSLCASLFLARQTTWLKLTYMLSGTTSIGLQLKAIGVFLSASASHQYILEFLEDGGMLLVLDILGQHFAEEDREEALRLLHTISVASSKYAEMICESRGVRAMAECLAQSHSDSTQEAALVLLESLARVGARYRTQVYNRLLALMTSICPEAQLRVVRTLCTVQSELKNHPSIVEPLLKMLGSLRSEVQDAAIGLILDLGPEPRPALLTGLVALLKPSQQGAKLDQMPKDAETAKTAASLPVFVQQAAAAKAIRLLAQSSEDISKEPLSLEVVHSLLYAMATREHNDAQIQASQTLMHFVHTRPALAEHVHAAMGGTLFATFMNNPDTVHAHMDDIQAEMLLSNTVNTTKDL